MYCSQQQSSSCRQFYLGKELNYLGEYSTMYMHDCIMFCLVLCHHSVFMKFHKFSMTLTHKKYLLKKFLCVTFGSGKVAHVTSGMRGK